MLCLCCGVLKLTSTCDGFRRVTESKSSTIKPLLICTVPLIFHHPHTIFGCIYLCSAKPDNVYIYSQKEKLLRYFDCGHLQRHSLISTFQWNVRCVFYMFVPIRGMVSYNGTFQMRLFNIPSN